VLAAAASAPASAQLSINRLWVDLDSGRSPRADLVIRNDSHDRYYVSVSPYEVTAPGTPQEARQEIADPDQLGLLVTPNRLILEPGATRAIRVVSLNSNLTRDRVYRVLIRPQVGAIHAEAAPADTRDVAIKILAAYEVLVVARPRDPHPEVTARRAADHVTLTNSGNSNVLLFDGRVCPAAVSDPGTDQNCRSIDATRLYAGASFDVPLQSPGEVLVFRERAAADSDPRSVRF
jgi:P pilus assembly chaperone PapD